jgi:uncharacterized protein
MDYRKFNDTYVIRLDIGDEVVECLKALCRDNQITLGSIMGFGTTNSAQIGLLETETKIYHPQVYTGDMEITCIAGTVSQMEGEVYLHVHANLALPSHEVVGGHLDYAVISAVAEIVIQSIDGIVEREYSDVAGVNLLKFK